MFEKLKKQWNDNPVAVIGVAGIAASGLASLVNAVSAAQGRRAYARQVNYKIKAQR